MSVIELIPEEEQLALQKEKELLAEKRSEGIKLLAEQNAQLNVVRSLKAQEELRTKKQKEEQGEQARLKTALDTLASQEEGLVRFKAQWEAIQPDLKRTGCADTVPTRGLYTVSTTIAGSPQAGAGAGQEKTDG